MSPLLQLLDTIKNNGFVETYRYFPDVALCGGAFLVREEIDRLHQEGYLQPTLEDRFGARLELSSIAKELLRNQFTQRLAA